MPSKKSRSYTLLYSFTVKCGTYLQNFQNPQVNLSCMALCPVSSRSAGFLSVFSWVSDEHICFLLASLLLVVLAWSSQGRPAVVMCLFWSVHQTLHIASTCADISVCNRAENVWSQIFFHYMKFTSQWQNKTLVTVIFSCGFGVHFGVLVLDIMFLLGDESWHYQPHDFHTTICSCSVCNIMMLTTASMVIVFL
jgi:hypothetical protein